MSSALNMSKLISFDCACLIIVTLTKGIFCRSCGLSNFTETVDQEENNFANISCIINITENSFFSDRFIIVYRVREINTFKTRCSFVWTRQFNNVTVVRRSENNEVACSVKQPAHGSSMFTFQLQVSQLVSQSISMMELSFKSDSIDSFQTMRLIRLNVLYPPNVTSLTVNGNEANGDYYIDEGQEVNMSCSFYKGNASAIFRLMETNGRELKRANSEEGYMNYSLNVMCEDDWPVVRCEGNGSRKNRSVSFLVNCPLQFANNPEKIFSSQAFETVTFLVKGHKAAASACLMTSLSPDDKKDITKEVDCTIYGNPPHLSLSLHFGPESNISVGDWMLTVHNGRGSANTTVIVMKDIMSEGES